MHYSQIIIVLFVHNFIFVKSYRANCDDEPWSDAECVRLTECPRVVNYIRRLHTTNSVIHRYFLGRPLLNMTCGFDGYEPKICCPAQNRYSKNIENHVVERPPPAPTRQSTSSSCGNILWSRSLTADGQPAELGEFPWLVLLEYDLPHERKLGCGGALISDRYVLTAAHCLTSSLARVRLGEHNTQTEVDCSNKGSPSFSRYCSDKAIVAGFDKYVVHPGYDYRPVPFDARAYDLALLRLRNPVKFSDYIKPICLPSNDYTAIKFLSAGWGASLQNRYLRSNVKLNSRMNLVDKNKCGKVYRMAMSGDFICAQEKSNKLFCVGDSGGPLMTFDQHSRMVIAGISTQTSINPCQNPGVPGIYIDVLKHRNWILANMQS